jgi:hypothetical protein
MAIEVILVQTESEEGVFKWMESGPSPQQAEWENASLGMARRASDQRDFRAEVFLCLKADYLVNQFEYEFCRALSEAARRYGWGAKLYIAVDKMIDLKPEQFDIIPHLVTWLGEIHDGGQRATDIVLANFDRTTELSQYHIMDLLRARDESISRYDMMPGLIIPDQWHCWAASKEYQSWLEDVSANDARNLIIVIKDGTAVKKAVRNAKEKIEAQTGGRFVLGCLGGGDLSRDVFELGRKYKIPTLRFRGLLELRYFLMRLNHLCQGQAEALAQTVEAVPVEKQVFRFGSSHRPRLLITSAFHPTDYETNCLDAVKDVGVISRAAPSHAECYVNPHFRAADLPDILKRMPELTVWLHLGHGDAMGLKDITGNLIKLDEWFARLQHSDTRLPLVFLSVCESAPVARKFVEAGVGVAIGFEKKVLPEMCRALAVPVVSAALDSGGGRRAILQAYNQVFRVAPQDAVLFKPKAFYSVR